MGAALLTKAITDNDYGNYNTRGQPMQVQDMLHHSTTLKHCDYVCQDSVKLTNLSDSDTQSELEVFWFMVLMKYHNDIFTVNANNCPCYKGNSARLNTY